MANIDYGTALRLADLSLSATFFLLAIKALRRRGFKVSELLLFRTVPLSEVATVLAGVIIAGICSALALFSIGLGPKSAPAGLFDYWFVLFFASCIAAPIFEEFIFRGYLLTLCQEKFGKMIRAVGVTSIAFAFVHPWQNFVGAFIISAWFCSIKLRTQSLLMCIAFHAAINYAAFFLLDAYLPMERILSYRSSSLTAMLSISAIALYLALLYRIALIYRRM